MSEHLQHRPRTSSTAQGAPSTMSSAMHEESSSSSASKKNKRKRTGIGDRLPYQERPYITPVGDEWEVHPYNTSRKPSTIMGALARIFYPDMIGPKESQRVALTWEDYKWSPDKDTPSPSALVLQEFWERFRCADGVDHEVANRLIERNMSTRVTQMLYAMKSEAMFTVYNMENANFDVDEDGNHWPTVKSLILAKPDDFATNLSWQALCVHWSTPSSRKKSLNGMKNRMAGGTTIYHCGGSRSLLATRQYLFIRDGVDPGEIGAWQHTHKMQQGTNNQLCCEKAAENFDKYAEEMNKKYGSNWQTTQPNIDTSVVAESTGGKPHGRYAMGDGLVSKPPKSKKRPRPRALPTEPCHSFYPSAQVVFQQVQSNSAWCAGVQRLLQELANKNALDINTFMHPLPPSIDIVALMQSQHPGEFSYLPVLNQIEANSEWRVGVERMLQVLAEKHFLDYDGLMHPQASEHQSSFSSGVGCSRNHNPHSACCSAAAT